VLVLATLWYSFLTEKCGRNIEWYLYTWHFNWNGFLLVTFCWNMIVERFCIIWGIYARFAKKMANTSKLIRSLITYMVSSMTSLLTHTVAYSTRPSFRSKTNNQPLKKFLSLAVSWLKVVKNCKILTFKVNFLCQKLSESF
jgi:hypothetical protein